MNYAYNISADDLLKIYPEAVELARQRGKKPGDDFGEEFQEIAKKLNIKITYLGKSEMDASLLTGNLREEGKKILNLNEEMDKEKIFCHCKANEGHSGGSFLDGTELIICNKCGLAMKTGITNIEEAKKLYYRKYKKL